MTEPKKAIHPFASVGGIAGAAGGWAFSQYCGACAWIPGGAAILLFLLFSKTRMRPKWFVGAITVTGAHVIWFIIGSAAVGAWAATALDIFALLAGIVWLWLRPGIAAVIFLGVVQLASLAMNVYGLTSAPVGSLTHRALTAHCIFRIIAVTCLVFGYIRFRRESVGQVPVAATTPAAVSETKMD